MKLLTFLLLSVCAVSAADSYSQATKFSLRLNDATVREVFQQIEENSEFILLYNEKLVDVERKVSVDVKNETVESVLNQVFEGTTNAYRIYDRQIVILRDENAEIPSILKGKVADTETSPPQGKEISGKVTDTQGLPLPGVSVVVKGTTTGTVTNADGEFSLSIPEGAEVLQFSFVGMQTQEMAIAGRSTFNVVMEEDFVGIEEVVAIGYSTQKKVNLTGAISTMDMKMKNIASNTNTSQVLHGIAGLWVNQTGSKPGRDNATIKLRGIGTLNNSNPLILVNGIEYDMNEVNPNDIENVTILKDASAAIYGSRAANGVILITTKTGNQEKVQIDYNFNYGIQQPTMMPDVIWDPIQYMQLKNQALRNEGKTVVDYSDAQIEQYKVGMATNPYAYPNINWFDLMIKNGYIHQHNLRVSGGSEKVNYSLSLGYLDQDGINIANDHANRYSLNVDISAKVMKNLRVGTNIIGNYRNFSDAPTGTANYFNTITRVLPIFTPYTEDGRYGTVVFKTPGRNMIENPMKWIKEGMNKSMKQSALIKIFADYQLPFRLKYSVTFGIDKRDGLEKVFVPQVNAYNPLTLEELIYPVSYATSRNDFNLNYTFFQTLSWDYSLSEKHQITAMIGTSYNDFRSNFSTARTEGFLDKTLPDLNAGGVNPSVTGASSEDRLASYFGRINYDFQGKYLFEAIFRYDGSSRFARGNRWGSFPGLSAGWRIDKEDFFKNVDMINLLKLRASYGKLGNQSVPLYSYINAVSVGSNYTFNNIIQKGAAVTAFNDPEISWETTTTYNAGLDMEAWSGKFGFGLDIFKKRTSGILRPVNIPSQVGALSGPQKNIGVMDNSGYELNVSHRNVINHFRYELRAEAGYVKNKVVDIAGQTIISSTTVWPRRDIFIIKEGYPIDSYYLLQADGIYQNTEEIANSAKLSSAVKPGYLRYKDVNSDGKIDGNDRVIVSSSNPKYTYSFTINLGYKNFSLNTFFQGVQGLSLYPGSNLAFPVDNGAGITKKWATDSWTPTNPNASLPILTTPQGASENYANSTFWLQDGSYLRLKTIQLSYDFPERWLSRYPIRKLELFLNGQDLFTFSKYEDSDPERNIKTGNLNDYPLLKTLSMGVNISF